MTHTQPGATGRTLMGVPYIPSTKASQNLDARTPIVSNASGSASVVSSIRARAALSSAVAAGARGVVPRRGDVDVDMVAL